MTYELLKHYPHDALDRVINLTCQKCGWQIYTDYEDYHYQRITQSDRGYVRDTQSGRDISSYKHKDCFGRQTDDLHIR
jgi:hypothetical protein